MKRLLVWSGVLALAACTKVEDSAEPAHKVAERPRAGAASRAPSGIEKRVLDLATCGLEGYQITSTCPAMEALSAELRQPGTARELSVALGGKLLQNPAPAVRLQAAAMLGTDTTSRDAIVDAARREPDVNVREAMIRIIAADGARYPRVGQFLLESTQHPSSAVREQALLALTLPASRQLPGAADRVLAMAERDPDPRLRQAACAAGGKLGDARFVAFYDRVTQTTDEPDLYAACMEGVVAMFHNQPSFDTASEEAYRLFLRRISATPRTQTSPPWQVMSAFCYYSHDADLDKLAAWKRQATWFDPAEVKTAMTAVVTDEAASWQARAAAVESLVGLGTTRAELDALAKTAADKRVAAKLDSALTE